jgi:hypothetical protein
MAAFRAITAEEEAASGLMFCLQELSYPNAEKLLPHNHQHKNAISAFFIALSKDFRELMVDHGFAFDLALSKDPSDTLELHIRNPEFLGDNVMIPVLPLDHFATTGDKLRSFTSNINELASEVGVKNIRDYIRREANVRNQLLYASMEGISHLSKSPIEIIECKRRRIVAFQYIYLMIKPHSAHQNFVQQCLDAFLAMLKLLPLGDMHPES